MNVGVVEPQGLIRRALCALLVSEGRHQVALSSENALDSVELIKQAKLHVLLMDPANPVGDLSTVAQVHRLFPELKLLLLSDVTDEEFQFRAIEAGAWGCISKNSGPEVLERALKVLEQGELWMSRRLANRVIGKFVGSKEKAGAKSEDLTPRELEILALLSRGCRNKEIAGKLFISENTVKTHLAAIYRKLNVTSRTAAASYFFQSARKTPAPAGAPLYSERPDRGSEQATWS